MRLWKAHALGNDYLVLAGPLPTGDLPRLAVALCDRHRGPGADGLLVPVPGVACRVRIFNPDGSEAETSGNGIRIFARFLYEEHQVPDTFDVSVGDRVVACAVRGGDVEASMGRASFRPEQVPCLLPGPEALDVPLAVEGRTLTCTAVGLGNPHCVVFGAFEALPWHDIGRALERHPCFPHRTNVQFARITNRSRVEIRIWERGAGVTQASGSSACAVAAAGVRTGRLDPVVSVRSPGGVVRVRVDPGFDLHLAGPVSPVGEFFPHPGWLEAALPGG
ncbi:MAG: diaminopimelate epimerase [Deltaproteobacteria bacterium]|nr:diaminopimelate epimerase [Deltaproteobacteria bacterium]